MIIGTAGHIDHGKTALIKALTGMDADRLPEEKARGITIDLGYAFYPLPHGAVLGFIDVPGHERFVHNMLAGATGIDFVLLVVAADDGVMPQTREHLEIIDLLGVKGGAVALTKIDRVESARVAAARADIEALLRGTALAGSPVFALSSMTGDGVPALRAHLEAVAASPPPARAARAFRHWTPVHVHLGAADEMGHVSLLQATGIEPGGSGQAQIVLDRPIGALRGDRFILRDQSAQQTLAGGVVLDPFAPARKVRTPTRLAVLAALERPTMFDALQQLLNDAPAGVDLSWFAHSFNLRAKAAETLYREIPMVVVNIAGAGRFCFAPPRWETTQQAVLAALAGRHRRAPAVVRH